MRLSLHYYTWQLAGRWNPHIALGANIASKARLEGINAGSRLINDRAERDQGGTSLRLVNRCAWGDTRYAVDRRRRNGCYLKASWPSYTEVRCGERDRYFCGCLRYARVHNNPTRCQACENGCGEKY